MGIFVLASTVGAAEPSESEREILERGEIETSEYVAGGVIGTIVLPFGIGQAIQGRYSDTGWIFTVGELASLGLFVAGGGGSCDTDFSGSNLSTSCSINPLSTVGIIAVLGFRIWEIVDLWASPPSHNRKYKRLKEKYPSYGADLGFSVTPVARNGRVEGGALGVRLRF